MPEQPPPPQPINHPPTFQDDDADNNEMELLMQSLSQKVKAHPYYAMCALHISAWREFHTVLKEEFKERVTLLDERYLRFARYTDFIQISIIVLSALSAFLQAGSSVMGINAVAIQFTSLTIATYTGLVLAIAKYKKFDEKRETIHNLRDQCADFISEVSHRDDQLGPYASDKLWTSVAVAADNPENILDSGISPSHVAAWASQHGILLGNLTELVTRKQRITNAFEKVIDTNELSSLVIAAKAKYLETKKAKLDLDKQFLEHAKATAEYLKDKGKVYQRKKPKLSAGATQGFTPYNGFNVTSQSYPMQRAAGGMQYNIVQEQQPQSQLPSNLVFTERLAQAIRTQAMRTQTVPTESPPPGSDHESWADGNEPPAQSGNAPPSGAGVVQAPITDPRPAAAPASVPVLDPATLEETPVERVGVPALQAPTDLHRALDDENIVIHTVETEDENV